MLNLGKKLVLAKKKYIYIYYPSFWEFWSGHRSSYCNSRYPETRRPRSHGIRNNRKKTLLNVDNIINDLKFLYNNYEVKRYIDTIKGTSKKLITKIWQKILLMSNQFDRRFVDIIAA